MKKMIIVPVLIAMLTGCETIELPNGETTQPLLVATQKDCHPDRGDKFVHDGSRIVVLQVIQSEGFVLAREIDYRRGDSILDRGLTIRVDTKDDYVNDELLRPGVYEYIGTYTGARIPGRNTIRMFKQVSVE